MTQAHEQAAGTIAAFLTERERTEAAKGLALLAEGARRAQSVYDHTSRKHKPLGDLAAFAAKIAVRLMN
jgi:hypothetical protein